MSQFITHHSDIIQGTKEWLAIRCGLLTASEMHLILTPTGKTADNKEQRAHLYELMGQRITEYVEPSYVSSDMIRGTEEEIDARRLYIKEYAEVEQVGFITNSSLGFKIGYSPDGLVGKDGLIEIKSRRQKIQIATIIANEMPGEVSTQVQTGLFVAEREWCDYLSYCGGLPMFVKRIYRDEKTISRIKEAATGFEEKMAEKLAEYHANAAGLHATVRRIEEEMHM